MSLGYLIPRLARRFAPPALVTFLKSRHLLIRPGLETFAPEQAAERYLAALARAGRTLRDASLLLFGYGGGFALGCQLLERGAGRVVLYDRFAAPDDRRNAGLLPRFSQYLGRHGARIAPVSDRLQVLAMPESRTAPVALPAVDVVFSSSVFEHVSDVDAELTALAPATAEGGVHLHFIDLRDHFFRYPFDMLCYTERVWADWLNPDTHHNRYRTRDYERAFERRFERVAIEVIERNHAAFERARPRIRPEFLTGDDDIDAATQILVVASDPRRTR